MASDDKTYGVKAEQGEMQTSDIVPPDCETGSAPFSKEKRHSGATSTLADCGVGPQEPACDPSHNNNNNKTNGHRRLCYVAVATLIVVAVAVVVFVVCMNSKPRKMCNMLEKAFPDPTVLPKKTIEAIKIGRRKNPQKKALTWLAEDPNLDQYSMEQKRQRLALATIYYATDGKHWFQDWNDHSDPWLDYDLHECDWYSLAGHLGRQPCYNFTGDQYQHTDYTSLVLSGKTIYTNGTHANPALMGTLPPELGLLTALEDLDLGYQKLRGSIPTELTELSDTLSKIVLEKAYFTGTIPKALFEFARILYLNHNDLLDAGNIPSVVGRNPNLAYLGLVETNRIGSLPAELFRVTTLKQMLVAGNRLTGTIPTEIGRLEALEFVYANVNHFNGPIPSEVGLSSSLVHLHLATNRVTGTIPTQLGLLANLQDLELAQNILSGPIPSQIGGMTHLFSLLLQSNKLTGTLPTSLSQLGELTSLDISSNDITGSLPPELMVVFNETTSTVNSAWPHLEALCLADNRMLGTIPSEIGMLGSLQKLWLHGNSFGSTVPSEIGRLEYLHVLLLDSTAVTGAIPGEICLLPLVSFDIDCSLLQCPAVCPCTCA